MRSCGEGEIGAINERARRTIAPLVDRAARRLTSALAIVIDEWFDRPTSTLVDRRATQSSDERCNRQQSLFFLSLSDLGSLFSLSLSLSLSFRK